MTKETPKNLPISSTLDGLSVGESATFPIRQFASVKNVCSVRKITHGSSFKTHINREKFIIEVTRCS